MNATERLRDVAVPANWQMRAERLLKIFGGEVLPFNGAILPVQKSGRMVVPMNFVEPLMAKDTFAAGVPLVDNRTNETGLRRYSDLRQTLLAAALAPRPTGTPAQGQVGRTNSRPDSSLCCRYIHSGGLMILRTGNNSLSAEFKIGAKSAESHDCGADGNHQQKGHREVLHGIHPFPGTR